MKRIVRIAALVLLVFLVAIQFIPVERTNPPVRREIHWDSPEVADLARRACYDCHSNETVWPWYSYVAPISWRVTDHVNHGRRHLNFSEWNTSQEDLNDILASVKGEEMPLEDYLWLHPEAVLDGEMRTDFIQGMGRAYQADPPGQP